MPQAILNQVSFQPDLKISEVSEEELELGSTSSESASDSADESEKSSQRKSSMNTGKRVNQPRRQNFVTNGSNKKENNSSL